MLWIRNSRQKERPKQILKWKHNMSVQPKLRHNIKKLINTKNNKHPKYKISNSNRKHERIINII